jgi:hypothetical protein
MAEKRKKSEGFQTAFGSAPPSWASNTAARKKLRYTGEVIRRNAALLGQRSIENTIGTNLVDAESSSFKTH